MQKLLVIGIVVLSALATQASSQEWPAHTLTMINPFAAGGPNDVPARLFAQRMGEIIGQSVIVENVGGAGGMNGADRVAKAPPDGYTVLITSASFSFNPGLYSNLRFDPLKDFAPISLVIRVPHVIVVLPTFPARNLQEFVKIARARPGEVLYASSGPGSAMHLAGALFGIVTNTKLTHVPYKGGAATITAVLSGEATTAFNTLETAIGQIKAGKLRALAVSTRERSPAIPDVPTAAEAGVKDYEALGWFGFLAPAGTPQAIVEQLSGEMHNIMTSPQMRERTLAEGATPVGTTPAEFQRFLREEITKWTRVIRQAGIKLE